MTHMTRSPVKSKPKNGDRKLIGGVVHVRQMTRVRDLRGNIINYDCTGGRQRHELVPVVTNGKP
jgi:hypothetical protein